MKYLVDTCGWIEWLTGGKLVVQFDNFFKNLDLLIVPTIVQFELYKWICREKDERTALEIIAITEQATVVSLNSPLAIFAAKLAGLHKLAMADAVIYASSQYHQSTLITCDSHFKGLAGVTSLTK